MYGCEFFLSSLCCVVVQNKPLLELSSLSLLGDQIRVRASEWLSEESSASFDSWKEAAEHQAMSKEDIHRYKLMQKYAGIWRMKTQKGILYNMCTSICYED